MHNLTTNQRAPRSPKRTGVEGTLRPAWIKRNILPVFCLNDPPAVGSSSQVTILEDFAVVRGVWSRTFLTICLLGRVELKKWLVEGGLRYCRGFAGGN